MDYNMQNVVWLWFHSYNILVLYEWKEEDLRQCHQVKLFLNSSSNSSTYWRSKCDQNVVRCCLGME